MNGQQIDLSDGIVKPEKTGNKSAPPAMDLSDGIVSAKDTPPPSPGYLEQFGKATVDQLIGMAKAGAHDILGVGMVLRKYIPGLAWAGNKISDYTLGHHISEQEFEEGREKILGLAPTNFAQKVGYGATQIGEYFLPGSLISKYQQMAKASSRFAEAFPKITDFAARVSKESPAAGWLGKFFNLDQFAAGTLEAVPAVAIAKAQGVEDTGQVAAFAMAGPTFGQLLNRTGASRAATGAAKSIVETVSKTIAEKIPEVQQSPRQMMWRALKPYVRNRDFDQALDRAMPEIYEQARMSGTKVDSVESFMKILKDTKARIWKPYEEFLGKTKAMVDGNTVADAITQSVKPRQIMKSTLIDDQGNEAIGGTVKGIYDWADKLRRKFSLPEAEEMLQNVNAEIQGYYNKYPAARHAVLEAHPELAAAVKEAEAWRRLITEKIDAMDKIAAAKGADPIAIKHLKSVYGGLLNLEQEGYRRVNVAKRLAPESLTEQLSNVHAAGRFVKGVITKRPLEALSSIAEGLAYKQAAKVIKERNTSDYLIKKAFQDFGEYVEQAKKAHRIPTAIYGTQQGNKPSSTAPRKVSAITHRFNPETGQIEELSA